MMLSDLFNQHWKQTFSTYLQSGNYILLAASGGLDSTVLAHLFKAHQIPFILGHMNFQLRGEESLRDESFVRSLGMQLGVDVLVKQVDTKQYAIDNKLSTQEAARELRYNWFSEILQGNLNIKYGELSNKQHPHIVATAHHADDSIETVLMHFFRGTGIEGLKGIPAVNDEKKIIRPLLPFSRMQLESFATEFAIEFITDSSNDSNDYTRNYFRNTLIPQLQTVFPNVKDNLLHNMARIGEAAELYKQAVNKHLDSLVQSRGNEIHVPILKLLKINTLHTIIWELIKPYGFKAAQVNEVIKLTNSVNGSEIASSSSRIIKSNAWLIIAPLAVTDAKHIVINGTGSWEFDGGFLQIQLKEKPVEITAQPQFEWLDASKIKFPLLLRKWKQSDYFYPLGLTKKKKLSKFFSDIKLNKIQKEAIWVIEMDKKIICVLGCRIDNRFKYQETTQQLLQIHYRK